MSTDFVRQFVAGGFRCAFGGRPRDDALIEVYPHVALLALSGAQRRLPYKTQKTLKYWPNALIEERGTKLLAQWRQIVDLLRKHIYGIDLELPQGPSASFSALKRFEDQIDALVCAWVGVLYIEGKAAAIGDVRSAIWIPTAALAFEKSAIGRRG